MTKYNPGGWWNRHAQARQSAYAPKLYPGLSLSQQQIAAFMAYQPAPEPARVKPVHVLSEAGNLALNIIDKVAVRAVNGAGYYYSDYLMQQVCWITKRVIDELRQFHLVEKRNGLFVPSAVG